MSEPIVVTAILRPRLGELPRVLAAVDSTVAKVHQEPGCQTYAVHRTDDATLILLEKWESAEALADHEKGQNLIDLSHALEGLLYCPIEIYRARPHWAGSPDKGLL